MATKDEESMKKLIDMYVGLHQAFNAYKVEMEIEHKRLQDEIVGLKAEMEQYGIRASAFTKL